LSLKFWLSALELPLAEILPLARHAEELGYEGIALTDHVVESSRLATPYPGGSAPWSPSGDWPDIWGALGALASGTSRIKLLSNVLILPLRHPLEVAKAAATIAELSGRFVLGVGLGWLQEEYAALGEDFRTRGARADEALGIIRQAWLNSTTRSAGKYYPFAEVHVKPKPSAPIDIWVGGDSGPAIRRAAAYGNGWIGGLANVDSLPAYLDRLKHAREQAGRAAGPFALSLTMRKMPDRAEVGLLTRHQVHLKVSPWKLLPTEGQGLGAKLDATERFARLDHLRSYFHAC
jgi:probable F420-dependent oxidoreductase